MVLQVWLLLKLDSESVFLLNIAGLAAEDARACPAELTLRRTDMLLVALNPELESGAIVTAGIAHLNIATQSLANLLTNTKTHTLTSWVHITCSSHLLAEALVKDTLPVLTLDANTLVLYSH